MKFVIGGRSQGKTAYALRLAEDERKTEKTLTCADGRKDPFDAALAADVVCHLEAYIRRLMESEMDPCRFTETLIKENPSAVITADEIGCGIVPVDAFEREYRETDGRVCQDIAEYSGEVYRVTCAIAVRIK